MNRKEYVETHREQINAYKREWYKKNKDKCREYQKYRESHPDVRKAIDKKYRHKYYLEHKEELYQKQLEYRRKNSKKCSELVLKYKKQRAERMKKEGIINPWSVINNKAEPVYRLHKLKIFLQKNYPNKQVFNTRNITGDFMYTVYDKYDIQVDYCPGYNYLEIFGLSDKEFNSLINEEGHLKTFKEVK